MVDPFLKGGGIGLFLEGPGDLAEDGILTRGQDNPGTGSRNDVGAHEGQVAVLQDALGVQPRGLCEFFDVGRFPGQRGFTQEEVLGRQDAHVGRDHVAGGQLDDVADHGGLHDPLLFAVLGPDDGGRIDDHAGQFVGGIAGPEFLDKAKNSRHEDHGADDGEGDIAPFFRRRKGDVGQDRDQGQRNQDQGEGVDEGRDQTLQDGDLVSLDDDIVPVESAACCNFFLVQAALPAVQEVQHPARVHAGGVKEALADDRWLFGRFSKCASGQFFFGSGVVILGHGFSSFLINRIFILT